jgi:hypothetical protein
MPKRYAVTQINRVARHLVSLRPAPHREIHLVRGRRVQAWIALVDDDAARAIEAATGGQYSRSEFQARTITKRAVAEFQARTITKRAVAR